MKYFPPLNISRLRLVTASWHTLKLIVTAESIQGNMDIYCRLLMINSKTYCTILQVISFNIVSEYHNDVCTCFLQMQLRSHSRSTQTWSMCLSADLLAICVIPICILINSHRTPRIALKQWHEQYAVALMHIPCNVHVYQMAHHTYMQTGWYTLLPKKVRWLPVYVKKLGEKYTTSKFSGYMS